MKTLLMIPAAVLLVLAADRMVIDAAPDRLPDAVSDADYYSHGAPPVAKVELGRHLFFDKILSGNRNIACATCHHPQLGLSDGLALPLGEGPKGLGPDRKVGDGPGEAVHGRIPRNSPALFNLGASEFTRLFHDGRVESDPEGYFEGGFVTPAKWKLPTGLENVLAAQAMFPVGSGGEMAGQRGENEIADAVALNRMAGPDGVWARLAARLRAVPEYVDQFRAAFPDEIEAAEDITFVHAANAIAAFETVEFRSDDSPYDRFLAGDREALTASQRRGMGLFYGEANCSSCHSGKFQTDHDFHAIAMPQIGPGKADGRDGSYWSASGHQDFLEDHGRGRVTMRSEDEFKFLTPSLRNVAETGPWGHSGSYRSLEDVVRHHLDPVTSLTRYELPEGALPSLGPVLELTGNGSRIEQNYLSAVRQDGFELRDQWVQKNDELRARIAAANELEPTALTNGQVDDLVAFLEALTSESLADLATIVPERVPSGLPVDD